MTPPLWDMLGSTGDGQSLTFRTAAVSLPALQIGATDVAVSWAAGQPPMPGTSWQAALSIDATSVLLGKLGMPQIKDGSKTTTGCVVQIPQSTLSILALGSGTLLVLAYMPT